MKERIRRIYNVIMSLIDWVCEMFYPSPYAALEGEPFCTTKGMWRKVWFYTGMIVVGLIGYFVLHYILVEFLHIHTVTIDLNRNGTKFFQSGEYSMSVIEWLVYLVTSISVAVTPAIRFVPFGTNFIATIYFISVGYNTSFAYYSVWKKDIRIAILAFIISLVLCAIPYLLYKYKNIKFPKVFSNIVSVCFWLVFWGSTIFAILSFIPGIGAIAKFLYDLYNMPGAGTVLLILKILIYFFFLFNCLERLVGFIRKKAPIKHEWDVSFHLMYTVTIMINWIITFVVLSAEDIMNGLINKVL